MKKLFNENELVYTKEGIEVKNQFQEIVNKFYNECRDKDISIRDLQNIMYHCLSILPITELLRNNE